MNEPDDRKLIEFIMDKIFSAILSFPRMMYIFGEFLDEFKVIAVSVKPLPDYIEKRMYVVRWRNVGYILYLTKNTSHPSMLLVFPYRKCFVYFVLNIDHSRKTQVVPVYWM